MGDPSKLAAFILALAEMLRALQAVARLDLPDAWIGAGFIRNAVWDALHGTGHVALDRSFRVIDALGLERPTAERGERPLRRQPDGALGGWHELLSARSMGPARRRQ